MKLKLTHKLIILVSVPLVFCVAYTGTLAYLINQAEVEAHRHEQAKLLIFQCKILAQMIDDATLAMGGYSLSKNDPEVLARYRQKEGNVYKCLAEMRQMLGDSAHERDAFTRLETIVSDRFRILRTLQAQIEDKKRIEGRGMLAYEKVQESLDQLKLALDDLTYDARKVQEKGVNEAHSALFGILCGGTVLNVLLTLTMALYLSRNIGRRLNMLTENSVRLAAGEDLTPKAAGNDEIAKLDSVFHSMADALAEALRKERAAIANAVDVICSIDATGRFANVNEAAVPVWGFSPQELIGKRFHELCAIGDVDRMRRVVEEAIDSKGTAKFEGRAIAKDGRLVDMLWTAQWSEREQSLFCVAHDMTERRQIEKMKQDFVAMISHDLRTPLGSILGILTSLEEGVYGELTERGKQRVTGAQTSAQRLIALVNDLLDAEKLEQGMFELDARDLMLSAVTETSLDAVRALAEQHRVTIESDCVDVPLHADGDRLTQVLVNLLSNAIKFSPENGTVRLSASKDGNGSVEVSIVDSGRGIPSDMQEAIFEKFRQVDIGDGKRGKGTGLGLSICRAIVEAHGGRIGVRSQTGAGSTFWFRLPMRTPGKQF